MSRDSATAASLEHPLSLVPPLPRFAQIEPTGRCNLACRMCTVQDRADRVVDQSLADFRAFLDQMPGLETLHLQGLGEPLMNPHFFDMARLASDRGIRVSSNTNLTLLTETRARRCVDCGLASLSVSLDGAEAEVYEAIRRRASFRKVIRNLDRLIAARDAIGSALEVRGVMVLMRGNLEQLPALVRLLHAHGVDELLVQRLSSDLEQADLPPRYFHVRDFVHASELGDADCAKATEIFNQAKDIAAALGFRLHLPRLTNLAHAEHTARSGAARPGCRWPWEGIYLSAAGELMPCCMVASADRASFGTVAKHDAGLLERWHGEAAQAFRQALASDEPPAVCRSCALYRGTF
ncbi:MAG TPA: radical SAM protein [Burkholderiaceae bacterium]|nr:radical SAM protein [Burkholderiaceae bacterium]